MVCVFVCAHVFVCIHMLLIWGLLSSLVLKE